MSLVKLRNSYALRAAAMAIAAAAFAAPAAATPPTVVDVPTTITVPEVNVLNLLSPFLSLPSTSIGQQTLTANLASSIAVNQIAAASPTIEAVSISDKAIFGGASTSISPAAGVTSTLSYIAATAYGPGANLAGGMPLQTVQSTGGIAPFQQYGGLGNLGAAFQTAVSPGGAAVPSVVTLLSNAYSFTSNDLGVAKNYFANGGASNAYNSGTNTVTRYVAVAPTGYTLPTANGLPNTTTSVFDSAYAPTGNYTSVGHNVYGDSRPVQVTSSLTVYDPTAISGLTTNPAFPSGHTNYAWTDSILIGMMVPEFYQSMLLRASEYATSRVDLGVHYVLDVTASRAFASYDLAQLLNATNPDYLKTNVATGATAQNLNTQFQTAATALNAYLNDPAKTAACGGSLAACAASNPYNTYSTSTYGTAAASTNAAIYQSRMTYGLPALSYTQAPREQAPAGGPDASILLATIYGGSSAQAQALATSVGGPLTANLSTSTINQIIVNTENNAIAAFYGTSLSYWTRINLYDAAGYFNTVSTNFTGSLITASGDKISGNVTVGSGGVFGGSGSVSGNLTVASGGAFGAQGSGAAPYTALSVTGTSDFKSGSKVQLTGVFLPGRYTLLNNTGSILIDGAKPATSSISASQVAVDTTTTGTLLQYLSGKLSVVGDPSLVVTLTANLANAANTPNQKAVATAIDTAANAGAYGTNGATLLNNLISTTVANGPAAFDALSGEGLTGQQQTALNTGNVFVSTVLGQATFWSDGGNDVFGMKDGGSLKDGYEGAVASRARVWASGFGQYATLTGQTSNGSANLSSQTSGVVTGVDYQVTQHLLAGIAAGYSSSNFSVDSRATSGTIDGAHVGIYGVERWGAFYVAGTAGYSHYNNTTDRFVTGLGAAQEERARFSGDEWLARFEGGYKTRVDGVNVTPFAGFQLAELSNNAFSETNVGAAVAGLNVSAQTVDSEKTFLGVQFDAKNVVGNGWVLTPYARLSWEHEFNTDRSIAASLLSLPGSAFTVYGASAASDVARVNAGFKLDVSANVAVFTSFDGEFSGRGNSYTGTGGVKIRW
jgi:subtilase-type serine protease